MPAAAECYRELPVMLRLEDGTLVDGRIDLAWRYKDSWIVVDYKTDRREKRNAARVQLYALAPAAFHQPSRPRGIVLEV